MSPEVSSQATDVTNVKEAVWPEWVYPYSAGLMGGLLGGAVMALVGVGYGLVSGIGVWRPINLVAAALLRGMQTDSLEYMSSFHLDALIVGLVIHLSMSIGMGVIFSYILPALPGRPLFWGWVIGPLLWLGAAVAALPLLNPVMYQNVDRVSFGLANILYGLILGWWVDRAPMIHSED